MPIFDSNSLRSFPEPTLRLHGDIEVHTMRVYDPPTEKKAYQILVDRIWPRGIRKDRLVYDQWCKEIAPTAQLRKWFAHTPERWPEFRLRYFDELEQKHQILESLRNIARTKPLILLYSARDILHNQAVVLREALIDGTHLSET